MSLVGQVDRLARNLEETDEIVRRLGERNAKLERVAELTRRYLADSCMSTRGELRRALESLDDGHRQV